MNLSIALCLVLAGPMNQDTISDGVIIFSVGRGAVSEIYRVDDRGGDPIALTDNDVADMNPTISPDGRRILFASDRSGSFQLWVMNLDGEQPRQITREDDIKVFPAWSADGESVYFENGKSLYQLTLNTMDSTGEGEVTEPVKLMDNVSVGDARPDRPLLGISGQIPQLVTLNPGDEKPLRLVPTTDEKGEQPARVIEQLFPKWSPDGKSILFSAGPLDVRTTNVYISKFDGTLTRSIGATDQKEIGMDWSPSGEAVLIARRDEGSTALIAIDIESQEERVILKRDGIITRAEWAAMSSDASAP